MKLSHSLLALAMAAAMPLTACVQVNAQSNDGPPPEFAPRCNKPATTPRPPR